MSSMSLKAEPTRPSLTDCSDGRRIHARFILLAAVLLLVTIVSVRNIHKGEFHLNTDEAHHAMTGVYFSDFLSDLPLTDPVGYTYRYYARYPVLGLIHWPPFFHLVEGTMFFLLGPSVVTARITVLLFALLGFFYWFKLVSELQNEWTAAVATALLALLPSLLLYEKAVMLEIPSLALCIAASYFWIRYLRRGTTRPLYWFALFAGLALLTKQQSIYLAMFCLFTVLAERKWRHVLNLNILRALGIVLFAAGPFYVLAFKVHWQTIAISVFDRTVQGVNPYAYYWLQLPDQVGLPLFLLSVFGVATCWWWGKRESVLPMLMWIAACYVTSTLIGGKEPRYILYWTPPIVYFAVSPLTIRFRVLWARLGTAVLALSLLFTYTWSAWAFERPYLTGYAAAAKRLTERASGGIILFDGDLGANFIFYLRTFDPARQWIVMRKALYITRNAKEFGSRELIGTTAELGKLIQDYGIKYILVEETGVYDFQIQGILREFLRTPQFTLVEAFPIESNIPKFDGQRLLLYQNQHPTVRTAKSSRLEMLTLDRDIVVSLDDMGIP